MNKQNDNSFDPDSYFRNVAPAQEFDFQNPSQIQGEVFSDPAELERRRLSGIRGWLLVYVILSVLSGILILFDLNDPLDSVSFCFSIAVIGTIIAGLILTFQRKRLAIKANILCEALSMASNLWSINYIDDFAWEMAMQGYSTGQENEYMLAGKVIFVGAIAVLMLINALWIAYFLKSRRVKYTLVR